MLLGSYPGASDLPPKLGSLGMPLPGQEVDVLKPDGEPCEPDEVGEIVVKRIDGWFPTKDRGHIDAEGYFFHDGRLRRGGGSGILSRNPNEYARYSRHERDDL